MYLMLEMGHICIHIHETTGHLQSFYVLGVFVVLNSFKNNLVARIVQHKTEMCTSWRIQPQFR